jgi:hypothetical protein
MIPIEILMEMAPEQVLWCPWLIHIIVFDDPLSVLFLEHGDCGILVPSQHCWIRLGIPPETLLAEYPERD